MKAVKKITMRNIGLDAKKLTGLMETLDREFPVARVLGKVSGFIVGESKINGEKYAEFSGDFEAVNLTTKEVYRSRKLILPAVAEIPLTDCVESLQEEDSFTFAFDVTVEPTHTTIPNMSNYQWGVVLQTKVEPLDFMSQLSESIPPPEFLETKEQSQIEEKPQKKNAK